MIKVSFHKEEDNTAVTMRLSGHAGMDASGHDIVCSAASILAYTVAQTLKYIHSSGGLAEEPQLKLDYGDAVICCRPTEEYCGEVLHTFFVAQVGFALLAQNYPQYVELKMFGKAL